MCWWIKLLAAVLVIALLLWLGWSLVNGVTKLLGGAGLNVSDQDPMFAEEAVHPTRPPEMDEEVVPEKRPTLDDLVLPDGAPVDKTVDELIDEARERDLNT